jgi:hypothetical protein
MSWCEQDDGLVLGNVLLLLDNVFDKTLEVANY